MIGNEEYKTSARVNFVTAALCAFIGYLFWDNGMGLMTIVYAFVCGGLFANGCSILAASRRHTDK